MQDTLLQIWLNGALHANIFPYAPVKPRSGAPHAQYRLLRPGLICKRGAICPMSSATPQSNLEAGRHMPNIFLRPQSNLEAGRHMPNIFPYAPVQSERAIRYIQIFCCPSYILNKEPFAVMFYKLFCYIHHTMITDSTTLSSKLVCF